jgi:ABC-2 type transport system permease protein
MPRLWLIAANEYKRHVLNRGFLFAVLSVPLLIGAMIGLIMLMERMRVNNRPVGYVDLSGSLVTQSDSTNAGPVQFVAFPSEDLAQSALEAGELQAYYILADDYEQSRKVELVFVQSPGDNASAQFYDFLRLNRLHKDARADWPLSLDLVGRRVVEGTFVTVRSADGVRVYNESYPVSFLLPFFIGLGFIVLLTSTSTTLAQAFAEEKENRTIEVLATSVSPGQLVAGKVLGISAMGLTELGAWVAAVSVLLGILSRINSWGWLAIIWVHPRTLATIVVVAVPTYVMFAGLMIALGSTVADVQESQQIGGVLSLLFTLPIYATEAMVEHSTGSLAIGLSLFPFTALVSFCLLTGFSSVPWWQVGASVMILTLCATGAIWLAGRAFRLGMLRYGKRVDWRELLGRGSRVPEPSGSPGRRGIP